MPHLILISHLGAHGFLDEVLDFSLIERIQANHRSPDCVLQAGLDVVTDARVDSFEAGEEEVGGGGGLALSATPSSTPKPSTTTPLRRTNHRLYVLQILGG